ncbi:outer membrane protein [Kaistia adipata]|uniref:outer membrane protein n=1 Tax=Kaistia adipata TaxID=166954 RepID=UPI0003FBC33C|nr:outer membrane protein [Kaistia adipata]
MASSAFAADLTYEPAPVAAPQAFSWTGFYAGVHGGYGWGDVDYSFHDDGHYNDNAGDVLGHSIDGGVFGGQIGYNYQINNVVLGIAASLSWSDIGKSGFVSPYDEDDIWETKVDWFGTVTPRIGYAFDRAQIFAKGGLAFGRVSNYVHDDSDFVEAKNTRTGWTVGAGAEYAVTDHVLLGIEYNYVDLGSYNINQDNTNFGGGNAGGFTNHDVDTKFSTVTATIGYKF